MQLISNYVVPGHNLMFGKNKALAIRTSIQTTLDEILLNNNYYSVEVGDIEEEMCLGRDVG